MVKFICLTQVNNLGSYGAPSGTNYVSLKGMPFEVNLKDDIDFFDNKKQFRRIGFVENVINKIIPVESKNENELESFLDTITELSKTSKKKILSVYDTKEQVIDDIETDKQRFEIPSNQLEILKEKLGLSQEIEGDE
jgi:hypothetical protein